MTIGSVMEKSKDADNYQAKILKGFVVQLVLRAAFHTRSSPFSNTTIECNNLGVINHDSTPWRGLKEKQAQADALWSFKQLIMESQFVTEYKWVAAHQDNVKFWENLSLNKWLNAIVDKLTEKALITGVAEQVFISHKFPFKCMCIELDGMKVTGSPQNVM